MDNPVSRLVLGTAQLGMDYGVANRTGKPSPATVEAMLDLAWNEGVARLDTAQAYGESEEVIGNYLAAHAECQIGIISKLAPGFAEAHENEIHAAIEASADRLHGRLEGMLLHDASMLDRWDDGLGRALIRGRDEGLFKVVGVSVYTPDEFRKALSFPDIRLVQAPINVLDRTLISDGLIAQAREADVAVHIRSIFLQGLLLLDVDTLPPALAHARKYIVGWRALCQRHGQNPGVAALLFVAQVIPDAFLVVGCETPDQLAMNLSYLRADPLDAAFLDEIMSLPQADERVTRPYLWN